MKQLLTKLIQKFVLETNPAIKTGDLVYYGDNNAEYEAIQVYYSYDLKPFLFIRDSQGIIFGVPLNLCRSPYVARK